MSNVQTKIKDTPQIRFKAFNSEWTENKINEVAEINPHSELPNVFEYVDLESVVGTEMVSHRTETKASAPSRAQRLAKKGDVFYQTVRPYQKNNYYFNRNDENFVFSTGYAQLRSDFNGTFLLSVLQSKEFVKKVLENCTGTSYPAINPTTLGNLTINFPDTVEQTKIGSLFSQIDSLIASTQKEHDKLVTLKKCMLQKMFPKNGKLIPEIRFKGFIDEWSEKKLGDLGETFTGLSGKTKDDFGHGQAKFVTYMNVFLNPVADPELVETIEIDSKQAEVKYGDIFFTTSSETPEEVGMSSIWLDQGKNVYLNSFCFGYRITEKIDPYYIAYMLRSNVVRSKIILLAQGISRYNISKKGMMKISVPFPSYIEQQKIGAYFQNLDNLIKKQSVELEKLNNIKKTLLNKMFV